MKNQLILLFLCLSCRSDEGIKTYNSNPSVTITSHGDGSELREGYTEQFRAQASDPNHSYEELTVTWYYESTTVCESEVPDSTGLSLCDITPIANQNEVRVEVKDIQGAAAIAILELDVVPTASPIAEILSPNIDVRYYVDQKVNLVGLVSDEEDDADRLLVSWESDIDGFISIERFASLTEEGKILSLSFWRDEQAIEAWRNLEAHRMAQTKGREGIFKDYRLRVATVSRDYDMTQRDQAPADSLKEHKH